RLFHAVADEDDGVDLLPLALGERVLEDLADLSLTAETAHGGHLLQQVIGAIEPGARLELAEAAVEGELDVEAAERCRRLEHLALEVAGAVPGRLPARRRIEGEQQPAALARCRPRRGRGRQLAEEGVDRAAGRGLVGKPASISRHCCGTPFSSDLVPCGAGIHGRSRSRAAHAGPNQTAVSWNVPPPLGGPGSALTSALTPRPSSKAPFG